MPLLPCATPAPPDWRLHWDSLDRQFPWLANLRGCPQDPVHHAEGDVWIHTRMVAEALLALPAWRALPAAGRDLLFAAVLLHDVAKPHCTRLENGRLTSRGHSARGALLARRILWEHGAEISLREQLCALIRYHQVPFFLIERPDAVRMALRISQQVRCDHLALLAEADMRGRLAAGQSEILTRIALFAEHCRELGCLDRPWPFPSPRSRYEYFAREDRDPHYAVHETPAPEVILLAGPPGSGKDTWIARHAPHLPVVSLDALRLELGISPTADQGVVLQAARERARVHLRAGEPFVWNSTSLTADNRAQRIALFQDYGARTRVVHIEAQFPDLFTRNAARPHPVPRPALERMLDRWDLPAVTEAPLVEWWSNADKPRSIAPGPALR